MLIAELTTGDDASRGDLIDRHQRDVVVRSVLVLAFETAPVVQLHPTGPHVEAG